MRKVLAGLGVLVGSYISCIVGWANDNPFWAWLGLIVAGMLALALLVWIATKIAECLGWALTNALYLVVALSVTGLLAWHAIVPAFVGYSLGALFGVCLFLTMFRMVGRNAQYSIMIGEVFSFLSAYRIRSYLTHESEDRPPTLIDKRTAINITVDMKNLVLVLKELGYTNTIARDVAGHTLSTVEPGTSFEDKVRAALAYIGSTTAPIFPNN